MNLQQSEETLLGFNVPQQQGNGGPLRKIGEVCTLKFGDLTSHLPVLVRGCHIYNNKVKYDLELAILFDDGWHTTRIYNVDSDFVYYGGQLKSSEDGLLNGFEIKLRAFMDKKLSEAGVKMPNEFWETISKDEAIEYLNLKG